MIGRAERHYVSIDGGAGAHLLGELRHANPDLIEVSSPRHADLMILVEPVSSALAPFVAEVYRALPRPRDAVAVRRSGAPHGTVAQLDSVLPAVRRVADGTPFAVVAAALGGQSAAPRDDLHAPNIDPFTVRLPSKNEREIATELVVVTLGPIQSFTAGPLRLVLVCDGEQVMSARVDAGYARRDIASAMRQSSWADAARLAAELDPLAPLAGRLAFVAAVEQIQGRPASPSVQAARDVVLGLERAQNHLSWLERFAAVLAHDALADEAIRLGSRLREVVSDSTDPSHQSISPSAGAASRHILVASVRALASETTALRSRLAGDRLLASRTRRTGVIDGSRDAAGVTGPVRRASIDGEGDVRSRLLVRLDDVVADLQLAVDLSARMDRAAEPLDRRVPAGEATAMVRGPRGEIQVRVSSSGGDSPSLVEWTRPSAIVLTIIPELLAGQRLADAEVIVASLDIATAEADG